MGTLLTTEQEEWLVRAAFGSRRGVVPAQMVATLAAAGLGEPNVQGQLTLTTPADAPSARHTSRQR
jgi:hypothetical protein